MMPQDDRDFLKTVSIVEMVELGLSEYAWRVVTEMSQEITLVTEYADMEISVCRRCHGWGCQPGPCGGDEKTP